MGQGPAQASGPAAFSPGETYKHRLVPRSLCHSTAELLPVQDAPCSPGSGGFTEGGSRRPGRPPAQLTLVSSHSGGPSPGPPTVNHTVTADNLKATQVSRNAPLRRSLQGLRVTSRGQQGCGQSRPAAVTLHCTHIQSGRLGSKIKSWLCSESALWFRGFFSLFMCLCPCGSGGADLGVGPT